MQSAQFQLHADIERRHWWFVARRRILTTLIHSVLPPSPNSTIVDVGCGTGANLAGLAEQYDCVGIDTSADAIRWAQVRFPKVRFIRGMAPRDLGEIAARARLILLTDVLEHVADDFAMFSELAAAAQPGTYFLLTVPADMALWSEHDQSFGHYRRYDLARFRHLWQGLPVREVFASHFNSRLYPVIRSIRTWNRWRGRAGGVAGTDFQLPSPPVNHLLTRCFGGEQRRLARLARREPARPYRRGVSLIALLQREQGQFEVRSKPDGLARDFYDPAVERTTASA